MKHRLFIAVAGLAAAVVPLGATSPASGEQAAAAGSTTRVTLHVKNCEGCEVTAQSAYEDHPRRVWSSPEKTVADGTVTFRVPTRKTDGLSIQVRTPWEGDTGYVTLAAFRYGRQQPGDRITFEDARAKKHASGCWAGTREASASMTLVVRKVRVAGVMGQARGQIAFIRTTQDYLAPMARAVDGVLGSQEVMYCEHARAIA